MTSTLLLPSQEELVQRLLHSANYSGQLQLLCGTKGTGKSTLTTVLASELEEHNSALVLCPPHAEAAEIRRKILVQLISSPIFDDEMPLLDTFLRIQSTLSKPLHIIIDDAHLLPKTLWAECILLSQMQCAGANIAITMAIDSHFLSELMAELSEDMREILLPLFIEPLTIAERDGLYQSLLLRSGYTPFIARGIIHNQLEQQSGTPLEVVKLLELAITEPEKAPAKKFTLIKSISFIGVLLLASGGGYFLWNANATVSSKVMTHQIELTATQQLRKQHANEVIHQFATKLVAPVDRWLPSRVDKIAPSLIIVAPQSEQMLIHQSDVPSQPQTQSQVQQRSQTDIPSLGDNSDSLSQNFQKIDQQAIATQAEPTQRQLATVDLASAQSVSVGGVSIPDEINENDTTPVAIDSVLPTFKGYTLQLASVRDKKSLSRIVNKLASEEGMYLAEYKHRHIILFGQFNSLAEAQSQAERLKQQGFNSPWLRKWQDLDEYTIQQESR
ncbi:AAA family ATPase [Shewanella gaetbuli]|uniref:AAA family ATPase n=1 Tax=Shewanella gaetbuli TaxID=220752 RepID=A0A9X1ZM72_9GAMM|nr:AAA family ATPase [Shewanella gaetbuli]MCL1143547.1 AAA family ATPase [Shewanella gaetbuli]